MKHLSIAYIILNRDYYNIQYSNIVINIIFPVRNGCDIKFVLFWKTSVL